MNATVKTKVIGVDIGTHVTTIALVNLRGDVLARDSLITSDFSEVGSFVEALSERIVMLAQNNGGYETIRSVGVSAPSANYLTGSIEHAVNLPWKGVIPIAALLRDRIGLAVAVGNNAHATALGESLFGTAHGMESFIAISLGHGGVGSCFFSKGRAHLGNRGSAGEIGHCCVVPNGRQCKCGRKGCLEEYVSSRGIIKTAHELLEGSDRPSLMRDIQELTPIAIGECCDKGDELAVEVFRYTGNMLGIGLANYASLVNPEAIILTGEQTQVYKWLAPFIEESFESHVFHNTKNKVKILVSTLDNHERDVLGASGLAWTVKEYSLFL